MQTDFIFKLLLEKLMPAEISAGLLTLYELGFLAPAFSALSMCVSMLAITLKKSFLLQAGAALMHEPITIIASGIIYYGVALALMLVFLISIVGFPIALLVFFVLIFFIFIGQASLSIMFGEILADKFNRVPGVYQSALIGALIIEGAKYLPYVQWVVRFLIIPVFALGMLYTAFVNGYVKKIFYPTRQETAKAVSDSNLIRGIILDQTNRTG